MKILQVIDSLAPGGAEKVCVELTNLLYQKHIDVSVLTITTTDGLSTSLRPGIQIGCLNRKHRFDLNAMAKLAGILRKYDIIHVHMRYTYWYVRLVAFLFLLNKKIILHDHYGSIDIDQIVPFLLKGLLKPRYYIGVSKDLTAWAEKKLAVNPDNIFLLENFVGKVSPLASVEQNTVVMVANFNRVKNHIFAIQVINDTPFSLTIYGKVHDYKYFNEIQQYIQQHGLTERVKVIHDEVNIQSQLSKYKFALHTARSESGPLVLIEYLAQAIPFLSYETGQVARKIREDLPDFFLDNFNVDEWQARVEKILKVDRTCLPAVYNKYFNPTVYLNNCLDIYNRINSC